jgi:hypothetical protein
MEPRDGHRPKTLCFQMQVDDVDHPLLQRLRGLIADAGASVAFENSGPGCVNLNVESDDTVAFWRHVETALRADNAAAWPLIIVCEGESSWDDYQLLWHFDTGEHWDALS